MWIRVVGSEGKTTDKEECERNEEVDFRVKLQIKLDLRF